MRKMRSKVSGEVYDDVKITSMDDDTGSFWKVEFGGNQQKFYDHLDEIVEEWEDYEELKKGWYLDGIGQPIEIVVGGDSFMQTIEAIGNHFETEEEAEEALEKLKAWKRLKDKGFRFRGRCIKDLTIGYTLDRYDKNEIKQMNKDLDLIFGGEE